MRRDGSRGAWNRSDGQLMAIRIGFDLDGVVADFAGAYRDVESRLFGPDGIGRTDEPEREEEARELRQARGFADAADVRGETPAERHPLHEMRRRRDLIWKEIQAIPDFWTTLKPTEDGAVRRIHALMLQHGWEVFFITQRPATAGETVQRQSQRWLRDQGFDLPSVLVIGGSRGAAAAALRLSYHVDDSPQNCIDVVADSKARTILIVPRRDELTEKAVKPLGIGVARSIGDALDLLEQVPQDGSEPGLLDRLSRMIGWK